jgi:hypothetical protein
LVICVVPMRHRAVGIITACVAGRDDRVRTARLPCWVVALSENVGFLVEGTA